MPGSGPDVPGPLVAEGRSATVHDIGGGWLLRRHREHAADATREAAVLRWAASQGVRVPAVREAAGRDLVLERVEGRSMLDTLLDDPTRATRYGRTLAALHRLLDRVPAPSELSLPTPTGRPGRLLHGDLHPGNVLLAATGPVLIDWTNAASGPSAYDTATTWLVLACLDPSDREIGARLAPLREPLLAAFLAAVDRAAAAACLPRVAADRVADREIGARLAPLREPLLAAFLAAVDRAAAAACLPRVAADRVADPGTSDAERARIAAFTADLERHPLH